MGELAQRISRRWGPSALTWPHRVLTIDTVMCELLTRLLGAGLVAWPGGHKVLEVHDSWKPLARHEWTMQGFVIALSEATVKIRGVLHVKATSRPKRTEVARRIEEGSCTHEEVRAVLHAALKDAPCREFLISEIGTFLKALIVDEVFDANELDLKVIELALRAGVSVSIIGDPWQALYGFRGATPSLVAPLVADFGLSTAPISAAFRWRSETQKALADNLRASRPVVLPAAMAPTTADVVLACQWKRLWVAADEVLPLAFQQTKGTLPDAAATLLLDKLIETTFGYRAAFLTDALTTLGLSSEELAKLRPTLEQILQDLQAADDPKCQECYAALKGLLEPTCGVAFPKVHANYTAPLKQLRLRLRMKALLIPGMTVHQAKGREWDTVGLQLEKAEIDALKVGLQPSAERDRQLYVACTRARFDTFRLLDP